jgi:hypothetical protein
MTAVAFQHFWLSCSLNSVDSVGCCPSLEWVLSFLSSWDWQHQAMQLAAPEQSKAIIARVLQDREVAEEQPYLPALPIANAADAAESSAHPDGRSSSHARMEEQESAQHVHWQATRLDHSQGQHCAEFRQESQQCGMHAGQQVSVATSRQCSAKFDPRASLLVVLLHTDPANPASRSLTSFTAYLVQVALASGVDGAAGAVTVAKEQLPYAMQLHLSSEDEDDMRWVRRHSASWSAQFPVCLLLRGR